jgi:hypothetical protein
LKNLKPTIALYKKKKTRSDTSDGEQASVLLSVMAEREEDDV